ncbi:MAG TPA: GntR family transcriptional regulator [Clostridiales bacterium]|nr:GntR family transcriptional regulator [Clostridiales bacterium]
MLSARDEQEYQLLRYLRDQSEPVGSGSAAECLRKAAIDVSEATAGRVLRELDARGYTERRGYQGRVLTDAGRRRLFELDSLRRRSIFGQELLRVLGEPGMTQLVDVLMARRAIERETARLAALNASDAGVAELYAVVNQHEHAVEGGGPEWDVRFHRMIAAMAGNQVLLAAVNLIHQDGLLSPVLDYIRKWARSTIAADHRALADAVARRDVTAAEASMVEHIDNIIADVRRYWATVHDREQVAPPFPGTREVSP